MPYSTRSGVLLDNSSSPRQGNSNSLSTVDIAAGYVGVTGHSSTVAVLLTASHTYAGPVLALLTALQHAERRRYGLLWLDRLYSPPVYVVAGPVSVVVCCDKPRSLAA